MGHMNMGISMTGMDYGLHNLPPHLMHQVGNGSIGARPPQKELKERKDKNAPKRNWSAYQFYVEEVGVMFFQPKTRWFIYSIQNRQGLRDANPDVSFGQISKIAAAQWRALGGDAKRRYEIMAENDKLR